MRLGTAFIFLIVLGGSEAAASSIIYLPARASSTPSFVTIGNPAKVASITTATPASPITAVAPATPSIVALDEPARDDVALETVAAIPASEPHPARTVMQMPMVIRGGLVDDGPSGQPSVAATAPQTQPQPTFSGTARRPAAGNSPGGRPTAGRKTPATPDLDPDQPEAPMPATW